MSRIQTPQLVNDLHRDLRDRHLLIPVVALLVALVAVPVLLSGGAAEPVPPVPPAAVDAEDAAQVDSAVLAETPGVRNYRKRLEALQQTNPFEQKFSVPAPSGEVEEVGGQVEVAGSSPAPGGSSEPTGVTPSAISGGSTDSVATDTVSSSEEPAVSTDPAPSDVDTQPADDESAPTIRFFTGRVDVTVGPLGKTKRLKGVRSLDFLPNDKDPVAAFLGLGEGADKAVFSISSEIVETSGKGHCAPKGPACQFLTLKVGQEQTLKSADGKTYRLRLLDTDVVRVPDPRDK